MNEYRFPDAGNASFATDGTLRIGDQQPAEGVADPGVINHELAHEQLVKLNSTPKDAPKDGLEFAMTVVRIIDQGLARIAAEPSGQPQGMGLVELLARTAGATPASIAAQASRINQIGEMIAGAGSGASPQLYATLRGEIGNFVAPLLRAAEAHHEPGDEPGAQAETFLSALFAMLLRTLPAPSSADVAERCRMEAPLGPDRAIVVIEGYRLEVRFLQGVTMRPVEGGWEPFPPAVLDHLIDANFVETVAPAPQPAR